MACEINPVDENSIEGEDCELRELRNLLRKNPKIEDELMKNLRVQASSGGAYEDATGGVAYRDSSGNETY